MAIIKASLMFLLFSPSQSLPSFLSVPHRPKKYSFRLKSSFAIVSLVQYKKKRFVVYRYFLSLCCVQVESLKRNTKKVPRKKSPVHYRICEQAKFSLSNKVLKKKFRVKKERKIKSCDIKKVCSTYGSRALCHQERILHRL